MGGDIAIKQKNNSALEDDKIRQQFSRLDERKLLKLYADLMEELRHRQLVRSSNNPISDYAENLIARRLGLTLVRGSTAGYDATDPKGIRYQIKARRITRHNASTQLGVIRNLDKGQFDVLLAGIFDASFKLIELWTIPREAIKVHSKFSVHQNGHIMTLRGRMLTDSRIKRLTADA